MSKECFNEVQRQQRLAEHKPVYKTHIMTQNSCMNIEHTTAGDTTSSNKSISPVVATSASNASNKLHKFFSAVQIVFFSFRIESNS